MDIVSRVDRRLLALGKSRLWLCQEVGVASNYFSRLNSSVPAADVLLRTAAALNVSPEWLFYGEEKNTPDFEVATMAARINKLNERDQKIVRALLVALEDEAPQKKRADFITVEHVAHV